LDSYFHITFLILFELGELYGGFTSSIFIGVNMAQSSVLANHIYAPATKWEHKGTVPCRVYFNVYSVERRVKISPKNLGLKAASMKDAIKAGTTTKQEAVRHLMEVHGLLLHEAVGLLR
jgi:hypothetical protein